MGFRTTLVDVYKKLTTYNKSIGIITNGVDNLYPERVDRYINNSVTAKTCAKIMASYIVGKGWGEDQDKTIVNKATELTLQKFTKQIAVSIAKQRGVFIQVNYNANYLPYSYSIHPYNNCRLGKKDDNSYNGKIGVHEDWANATDSTGVNFIDVYNPDEDVVKSQIEASIGDDIVSKVRNYKGQILYLNLDDEYIYSLSQVDPVLKDCDSEAQASIYKNKSLRKGFFGKTLVITKPLAGALENYSSSEDYHEALSDRDNFKETIEGFIGAESTGGVLHMEVSHESDNFEQEILFKNIDSNIDDKIFSYTEASVFENILMSFNSLPSIIIKPDSGMFGQSGESMRQAQLIYQNNTRQERNEVEQLIQLLMSRLVTPLEGLKLLPLIEEKIIEQTPKEDDSTRK